MSPPTTSNAVIRAVRFHADSLVVDFRIRGGVSVVWTGPLTSEDQLLRAAGVASQVELPGRIVRIRYGWDRVEQVGHAVEDDCWFTTVRP